MNLLQHVTLHLTRFYTSCDAYPEMHSTNTPKHEAPKTDQLYTTSI